MHARMRDLENRRVIWLKGGLFLLLGLSASASLLAQRFSGKNLILFVVAIWAFCRAYYFAFYVIEHYVDPSYRFSGLISFFRYLFRRTKENH